MNPAFTHLKKIAAELRVNLRLQVGFAVIVLVLLVEGGLRWYAWIEQQQIARSRLQAEVLSLKAKVQDEAGLRETLAELQQTSESVSRRLWHVSSEAVGQARLKDWLTDILKRSIADQYAITLAPSREIGKPGAAAMTMVAREFRASVSFRLTPRALEGVLLEIEGGEPFSAIETLVVKKQERRVELTVRVLMRIQPGNHV